MAHYYVYHYYGPGRRLDDPCDPRMILFNGVSIDSTLTLSALYSITAMSTDMVSASIAESMQESRIYTRGRLVGIILYYSFLVAPDVESRATDMLQLP